jgi:hypothetical protein
MIFTYWAGDPSGVVPFQKAWSGFDPETAIYGDDAVVEVLSSINPAYAGIYNKIRIPACKSDVARIALLYRYGGFYMDAHGVPGNADELARLVRAMKIWEIILFDEILNHKDDADAHILTGALAGWRGSDILLLVLSGIFLNLWRHFIIESKSAQHSPYNIFVLSGPWAVRLKLLTTTRPFTVRPPFQSRVLRSILDRDRSNRGFVWYVNYGYRRTGQHWSERQAIEPLFEHATARS